MRITPRRRIRGLVALVSGAIFAIGLAVAGMTRPQKVIGFLDVSRSWDPSLAFVMVGAIAVHATAWRLLRGRPSPLLASRFAIPTRQGLDARLLLGSAIFGIGWGIAGYCPGPGLASLGGGASPLVFVTAMLVGSLAAARVTTFPGRGAVRATVFDSTGARRGPRPRSPATLAAPL